MRSHFTASCGGLLIKSTVNTAAMLKVRPSLFAPVAPYNVSWNELSQFPQNTSDRISSHIIFQNFLGEHVPEPPLRRLHPLDEYSICKHWLLKIFS